MPQIGLDSGRGLVALLCRFGHQLQDDRRKLRGNGRVSFVGRNRPPRNVAVNPFERIGRRERQNPGQHFVERDAERIKIAARIDRAVHPARLLGRHVSQRPGDHLRRIGILLLTGQARGESKPVRRTTPLGMSTRILAGLMSL